MAGGWTQLKGEWRNLRRGRPGHRFRDHYRRAAHERRTGWYWLKRLGKFAVALVAVVVGLAEILFPGPAILFFSIAGSLLATESRTVAELMDWSEVKIRALARFARARWRSGSAVFRAGVVVVTIAGAAASALFTYHLLAD